MAVVIQMPGSVTAIAEGLRLLHEPGSVFEVRILGVVRAGTISGYFDDAQKAAEAIAQYDGRATGIYVTLNPVNPALLARAENRLREHAKETTTDRDVVHRRWLLIDVDPKRPAGISATKEEVRAAGTLAREIKDQLAAQGWPLPVLVASGNGAHLLYRIELENTPEATELVKQSLLALDARYSTGALGVDTSVFNAARISKVAGTLTAKGDSTKERPHRRSQIVEQPAALQAVSRELLEHLAAQAPVPAQAGPRIGHPGIDLPAFLAQGGLSLRRTKEQGDRTIHELTECPMNPEHNRGEAYVGQMASGALFAGCQHDSCSWWGWQDLRRKVDPDWEPWTGDLASGSIFKPREEAPPSELPADEFYIQWPSWWQKDHGSEEWVFPDVLAKGRGHAIYAAHKTGKSLLTLYMAAKLATSTDQSVVLYFDFEMTDSDLFERLKDMGYGAGTDLSRLKYALLPSLPPLDTAAGADALMRRVEEAKAEWPGHHLVVIIDTMSRVVSGPENDADTFRAFYNHTGLRLKQAGVTWARLDHGGKDEERGQRGSSAKGDDVDVIWRLSRSETGVVLKPTARMAWVPEKVVFEIRTDPVLSFVPADDDWPLGTLPAADDLDRLGVPLEVSVRKAEETLKTAGLGRRRNIVRAAVKYRQRRASTLRWGQGQKPANCDRVTPRVTAVTLPVTDAVTDAETAHLQAGNTGVTPGNTSAGDWVTDHPYVVGGPLPAQPGNASGLHDRDPGPHDPDDEGGDTPWRVTI